MDIQTWVRTTFNTTDPKLFLELGANNGSDTSWMAGIPNVTIHAFEPDARVSFPSLPNVTLHRKAVGNFNGTTFFFPSEINMATNKEWHFSSSIKKPKDHLIHHPITFGTTIAVEETTLDTFCESLGPIDFIWADIQGAEKEMIQGGPKTLAKTKFLYTEFSNEEMYEGQVGLQEILRMLGTYEIVELYPCDVLLKNQTIP
jgi:FkbM family methyltransferase